MNNGIVGITPGLGDYSPLPQGGGSWGGNRGRFHTDELRMFGYGDNQKNWLANAGAARVVNTGTNVAAANATLPGDIGMVINVGTGTILMNNAIVPFAAAYNMTGRYRQSGTGGGGTVMVENNCISDNVPGQALQLMGMGGLTSTTIYIANSAACTMPTNQVDINSLPALATFGGGTLTPAKVTGFLSQMVVGSGVTLTNRVAYGVNDITAGGASVITTGGAGTTTNQYGLDIPILTGAATVNTAIRIGAGGQTITAIPALTGQIDVYTGTTTLNFSSSGLPAVVNMGGTVSLTQSGNALGMLTCFAVRPTMVNTVGSSISFGPTLGLFFAPTWTANTQTVASIGQNTGYLFNPSTSVTNAGTITTGTLIGMSAGATIGASTTIALYQGVLVTGPTVNGALTTWVGVDINAMTAAGTNIGIRNASPTAFTPSTNQTLAAATAVVANATTVKVIQTSGASITLTAAPTIAAGQDGQILQIINVSTVASSAFIFQSVSSLAGSTLSLGATTRTVGDKGSLTLQYNATLSRWVEIGFNGGTFG